MTRILHSNRLLGLIALLVGTIQAAAHNEVMSQARLWQESSEWILEVTINSEIAEVFYRGKTSDPAYTLTLEYPEPALVAYRERALSLFRVMAGSQILQPSGSDVTLQVNHTIFRVRYPYHGEKELTLVHNYLQDLAVNHQTIVEVTFTGEEKPTVQVLNRDRTRVHFKAGRKAD